VLDQEQKTPKKEAPKEISTEESAHFIQNP
jgi:hypothetical protein